MQTTDSHSESYDAIVVGARVAGAATAMLLARAGLRVLAVDQARPGTDTLSTHALMRAGVLQLHRWGLLDAVQRAGTPPVASTAFHYGDEVIDVKIKPKGGIPGLFAPRRTVLDPIVVDAARAAGARVEHETRLLSLSRAADGRVSGATLQTRGGRRFSVRASIVIGADGVRSHVAKLVDARAYRTARHESAVIYGYHRGLPLEGYHWYWQKDVSAGAIATNDGHCVFVSTPPRRFEQELRHDLEGGYLAALRDCSPELAELLTPDTREGALRGFAGVRGYFRQCWGPGWALVGDAGYFKDPLTAHGISDALRDAELLARAVIDGGDQALSRYQAARDRLSAGFFDVTDRIASFDWDLPAVKQLHLTLSEEMGAEVAELIALDGASSRAA